MLDRYSTPIADLEPEQPKGQEGYLNPEDGFNFIPGLVSPEQLPAFKDEVLALETAAKADINASKWFIPVVETEVELKSQYLRTVATDISALTTFEQDFPVVHSVIARLMQLSGLTNITALNINRYLPHTQIPPHYDPEDDRSYAIYSIGVEGQGVFRVWRDITNPDFAGDVLSRSISEQINPGDAAGLTSIQVHQLEEEPYTNYVLDGIAPDIEAKRMTRRHSAENPNDSERIILLVGLN